MANWSKTRKRGNAQRDGRPLGGSVSPAIKCYWLVNASRLNCGRWVGRHSSPILSHLWTKVHRITFACAGVSVVCNTIFRMTTSCCSPEIFTIKSRSCAKSCKIWCFWAAKFLTVFYKPVSPTTIWQSLVTIGQVTSEIRRRKEEN